ncbi:nuclease-like protein [Ureibacillus xyleni]|uniref:Nuclease-like protein n=1 Tax=Ureibacillus xyleni TaxID=614648 RepID=A0A285RI09_9BACL|nr:nuclease-related domain-containing protein [Ureibacillus xyleni]SOB93711.1 nuclease-like protein [Ureibacillus xyleni]
MIVVERKIPSKIIVLEAIHRRAQEQREFIANHLKRAEIGYIGELKVDAIWNELEIPSNSLLFHNYEVHRHQLDTLFACPHFVLILEIKNVAGYIWYEQEKHQFLRKKRTGEIESFQSPIEQVKRNETVIDRVIKSIGLSIPLHKIIVIAEPSTVIGNIPNDVPFIHAIGLRTEIKKLLLKYSTFKLSSVDFELLQSHLMELYEPRIYKPKFEVPPLKKGAICSCGEVMRYKYGKFICICGENSKEPLFQGLHDYRILINEWITNSEFRNFFLIDNQDLVTKLMKRLNFYYEGDNRARRYYIPKNIWREY